MGSNRKKGQIVYYYTCEGVVQLEVTGSLLGVTATQAAYPYISTWRYGKSAAHPSSTLGRCEGWIAFFLDSQLVGQPWAVPARLWRRLGREVDNVPMLSHIGLRRKKKEGTKEEENKQRGKSLGILFNVPSLISFSFFFFALQYKQYGVVVLKKKGKNQASNPVGGTARVACIVSKIGEEIGHLLNDDGGPIWCRARGKKKRAIDKRRRRKKRESDDGSSARKRVAHCAKCKSSFGGGLVGIIARVQKRS